MHRTIYFPCPDCPNSPETPSEKIKIDEIRDDNVYEITCSKGHKNVARLGNLKFELLFEFGAMALLDGYTREAVASIAASLERFYEFYINVIFLKYGIPKEEFDKSWKPISKQSERQVGAFLFLYLLENKRPVNWTVDKKQEFRNKVIHAGYVPTREEVIKYGDIVLAFIFSILKELKATSQEYINQAIKQHSFAVLDFEGSGAHPAVVQQVNSTIINLSMPFARMHHLSTREQESAGVSFREEEPFGEITFRESLERLSGRASKNSTSQYPGGFYYDLQQISVVYKKPSK